MKAHRTDVLETLPRTALERLAVELGLEAKDVALALSVDRRTVERWRAGLSFPQHEARQGLIELWRLRARLAEIFSSAQTARDWLRTPSRSLGGLPPLSAIRAGRFALVETALDREADIDQKRRSGLAALAGLAAIRGRLPDEGPIDVVQLVREGREDLARRTEM